jgi:Putative transposase
VKIPLSGSVAGFFSDIACSTFTTSSSKPLPFRFDGCATSISLTEAAALVSGSGCNTNPLAYLSRYTHRVAIANSRLIAFDERSVTFKWKDYRIEGRDRYKQMTLGTFEFIRRFLIHVLPKGLHRIRHYGLFAKSACADNIARARDLLAVAKPEGQPTAAAVDSSKPTCPCCGGRMIVIEVFARGATPRHRPTGPATVIRIDTS